MKKESENSMSNAKKCSVVDLEACPPLPCEGDEGHSGPHFRLRGEVPNSPLPADAKLYFTGVDPVNDKGQEIRRKVELFKLKDDAEREKARAEKASAVAAEAAAAIEAQDKPIQ